MCILTVLTSLFSLCVTNRKPITIKKQITLVQCYRLQLDSGLELLQLSCETSAFHIVKINPCSNYLVIRHNESRHIRKHHQGLPDFFLNTHRQSHYFSRTADYYFLASFFSGKDFNNGKRNLFFLIILNSYDSMISLDVCDTGNKV